jgi:hypothetical protein
MKYAHFLVEHWIRKVHVYRVLETLLAVVQSLKSLAIHVDGRLLHGSRVPPFYESRTPLYNDPKARSEKVDSIAMMVHTHSENLCCHPAGELV